LVLKTLAPTPIAPLIGDSLKSTVSTNALMPLITLFAELDL